MFLSSSSSECDDMTLQLRSYKNYKCPKIFYAFRLKNTHVEWSIVKNIYKYARYDVYALQLPSHQWTNIQELNT